MTAPAKMVLLLYRQLKDKKGNFVLVVIFFFYLPPLFLWWWDEMEGVILHFCLPSTAGVST